MSEERLEAPRVVVRSRSLPPAMAAKGNGAAPIPEDGAVMGSIAEVVDRGGYFAAAYNAPTLFQSITFQRALR